jgi:hypothetical protein
VEEEERLSSCPICGLRRCIYVAEEQEKKEGTNQSEGKNEPPAQSGKMIGMLIVLVLIIIAIQIVYLIKSSRDRVAIPGGQPSTPSQTAAPAPPPDAPSAPTVVSGSAADGNLRMDRLIAGIVKLEESPVALSKDQARKALEILNSMNKPQMRMTYLSAKLDEVLKGPQKEFLKKQAQGANPATTSMGMILPETLKKVKDKLVGVAQQGITTAIPVLEPADETSKVPKGAPPPQEPGKPFVPSIVAFINLYDLMEKDKSISLSKDQARKILPIINAYAPPPDPQKLNGQLLAVLSKEQKDQVDKLLKSVPDKPEATLEYPMKLEKILAAKAR